MKYIDIGHSNNLASIWLLQDGRLEVLRATSTHEQVYGMEAMNFWRGRFEPETGRCSVTPPVNSPATATPDWLADLLTARFKLNEIRFFPSPLAGSTSRD